MTAIVLNFNFFTSNEMSVSSLTEMSSVNGLISHTIHRVKIAFFLKGAFYKVIDFAKTKVHIQSGM